jgi:hypothetical protein
MEEVYARRRGELERQNQQQASTVEEEADVDDILFVDRCTGTSDYVGFAERGVSTGEY